MQRNAVEMQRNVQWVLCTSAQCAICTMCNMQYRKYCTCWVLQKFEESCKILKKFVHAFVVNVIHAKVLPDFDL